MKTDRSSPTFRSSRFAAVCRVLPVAALLAGTACLPPRAAAQDYQWLGDNNPPISGNWSDPTNWDTGSVPNNPGANVIVPLTPAANLFTGPTLDIDVTIHNLTLVNSAEVTDAQGAPHNLLVLGTTSLTTTPDHLGEYGIINTYGGTFKLGTLTNYDASSRTLNSGGYTASGGGTVQWSGADIVTNAGFIYLGGASANILNQDNGANALANLAVNNGTLQFADGHNFTTAGDFTNNGTLVLNNDGDSTSTTFTVGVQLTNYHADTNTLSHGEYDFFDYNRTATLRFANADIRTLDAAAVYFYGAGSITDLQGNDGLRNLTTLQNGATLQSYNGQIFNPVGGTFTVNTGAQHLIDTNTTVTVNGDYHLSNSASLTVFAPDQNDPYASTVLIVNGAVTADSGSQIILNAQPSSYDKERQNYLNVSGGITLSGGASVVGTGTLTGNTVFASSSRLAPGLNGQSGVVIVVGALTLRSGSETAFVLGGRTAGLEYSQILQSSNSGLVVTLGGNLHLNFANSFETSVTASDTFDILNSDRTLQGAFDNVASGDRLTTDDGFGSFLVTYNGNNLFLSGFQMGAVPEPATWAAGLGCGGFLVLTLRRRARG